MSTYYDLDKPYSIENWNTLIRDVNEILEDPPQGSDCDPVDPIDEVEDPHLWSVEDAEGMRDKLKETCPDISFSEELVLWRPEIIDEIEEQMEDAWCDCETEPAIEEYGPFGPYNYTLINAAWSAETSNTVIQDTTCYVCTGLHCREERYGGNYYGCNGEANAPLYDTICATYATAYSETYDYISAINLMQEYAEVIRDKQDDIDSNVSQIDSLIEEYDDDCGGGSPPSKCTSIKARICALGTAIGPWQEIVDEYITKFETEHTKKVAAEPAANSAAAENWLAAIALQTHFPVDVNLIVNHFLGIFQDEAWGAWFDPTRDDKIADLFSYAIGARLSWEVRPIAHAWYMTSLSIYAQRNYSEIKFSPNGIPFIKGQNAKNFQRKLSLPYVNRTTRWRDDSPGGTCEFDPWGSESPTYWQQSCYMPGSCVGSCMGMCNWLWAPLPEPDLDDYHTTTAYAETQRPEGRKGTDNTAKQEEEWQKYLNWYDDHPTYDDRHDSYC